MSSTGSTAVAGPLQTTSRQRQVKADWSNGKVATTGLSYLGTMSNGLATTGVDGLEVIIAEAGILLLVQLLIGKTDS